MNRKSHSHESSDIPTVGVERIVETVKQPTDSKQPDDWLVKKLIEENSLAYRTVWDLYLKFYTAFLTFNAAALLLTVQWVKVHRWPIITVFVVQNIISGMTALFVRRFSNESADRFHSICKFHISRLGLPADQRQTLESLSVSPSPGWLGKYGGFANALSHLLLIICWVSVLWIPAT